jgi:hypothetical protein
MRIAAPMNECGAKARDKFVHRGCATLLMSARRVLGITMLVRQSRAPMDHRALSHLKAENGKQRR